MKTKTISKDDIIYQIEDTFDGIGTVIVDIAYSGNEDENGNEILEFEYAIAEETENTNLTEEQLRIVNKVLECGREEEYVRHLVEYYNRTGVNFDPNHYELS